MAIHAVTLDCFVPRKDKKLLLVINNQNHNVTGGNTIEIKLVPLIEAPLPQMISSLILFNIQ